MKEVHKVIGVIVIGCGIVVLVVSIFMFGIGTKETPAIVGTTDRLLRAEELIETLNGHNNTLVRIIKTQKSSMDTLRRFANRAIQTDSLSNALAVRYGWIKPPKRRE